jgi:hypothetical protein
MASPAKKWRRRVGALLMGLASLFILEAALRLVNAAPPEVPIKELYQRPGRVFILDGDRYQTDPENPYFAPQSFPARKAKGVMRVFVTGGSTAMGFPMEGYYGPTQLLALALDAVQPGVRHEFINAAGYGYSTYEVEAVVEELLRYEPDAIVLMTGQNEYLENRFGEESGFRGLWQKIRLYRVMAGLVSAARRDADKKKWEPHTVTAEERVLVRNNFRKDMDKIKTLCRHRGVKLILVTAAANLEDYRPHGPSQVPRQDQEKIDRELKQGGDRLDRALEMLKPWKQKYPDDAWLLFEEASVLRAKALADGAASGGESEEDQLRELVNSSLKYLGPANALFARACDLDPWPVRASSEINAIIRETSGPGVTLADPDEYFSRLRTDLGYQEADYFLDHCHLNDTGEETLAKIILPAFAQAGLVDLPADWMAAESSVIEQYHAKVPDYAWAQSYYTIGYETGVNMDRPARGLVYADKALKLDPLHVKARMLKDRLEPLANSRYALTGE